MLLVIRGKLARAEVCQQIIEVSKDFCYSYLSVCFKEKGQDKITPSPSDLMSYLFRYKPVSQIFFKGRKMDMEKLRVSHPRSRPII